MAQLIATNQLTLTNLKENAIDRTEISFWHGLSATKRPLGFYNCGHRDHQYGNEFNVTSGKTYTVRVIAKQTKGSIQLRGGIWYTAMTSGYSWDGFGDFTLVGEASEDGLGVYERKFVVASDKTKAKIFIQIEQGDDYNSNSTAWGIYDGQVFDENGQPLVTDQNNYDALASPMATPNGTYIWKRTITYYTDGTSNTIWEYSGVGANGKDGIAGKDGVGIKTTEISFWHGLSATKRPLGFYNCGHRDHQYGNEFNVTSGKTYTVRVIAKQTKGSIQLRGGIWYTAMTSGYSWDGFGDFTLVGEASEDGLGVYERKFVVASDKTKAKIFIQIEQGDDYNSNSTAWGIYDGQVFDENGQPLVTDQNNYDALASPMATPNGTYIWKRTITYYTDGTSNTIWEYSGVGANGKDGIAGKDGVGIKTTDITYAISTSGTTAPTSGWTSSVPTLVKGQYLWTKTVWTYTDNSSETGYSVTYISKDGNNGTNGIAGKDGTGIKTTIITYVQSTSGTVVPTSGWTSSIPAVPSGQFLWTKTVWTYTDNTSETGYSVAMMGPKGDMGKSIWSYPYDRGDNRLGNWWSDLKPTPTTDNPPKLGDTLIDLVGNIYQITKVVADSTQGGGGLFDYGPMLTSVKGIDGNPGKIVSDTEPTTKFKGLTWKYSGITAINASDGTSIQPSTEYYWNGNNWVINLINAHNINVDDLSAISTTLTNGKFISNWSSDNATGTTTIEKNHFIINSANSSLNTENTIALDNEQGMMITYNNKTNKQTISVGVNFQGFFVTDSTGPYVSVTPTGIVNSVDVSWTTIGSYAAYRRDGKVVTIRVVGAKTSTAGNIYIGTIPLKDCPAASVMGTALAWSASVANDKHIQINGLNQQNSGSVTILSAAANQEYTFQLTYQV